VDWQSANFPGKEVVSSKLDFLTRSFALREASLAWAAKSALFIIALATGRFS
jgi:hypothetical protein